MTLAQRFGRRLFMKRRRLGVSQEALAEMSGLSRHAIYLLENGRRTPGLGTIVSLSDALGIDPARLVAGLRP